MQRFKPLIEVCGQPLICHTIASAAAAGLKPVCLVIGAESSALRQALAAAGFNGQDLLIVENPVYAQTDMLFSVQIGIRSLLANQPDAFAGAAAAAGGAAAAAGGAAAAGEATAGAVEAAAAGAAALSSAVAADGAVASGSPSLGNASLSAGASPGSASPLAGVFVLPGDVAAVSPASFKQLIDAAELDFATVFKPLTYGRPGHPLLIKRSALDTVLAYRGSGGLPAALQNLASVSIEVNDPGVLLDADTPADLASLTGLLATRVKSGVSQGVVDGGNQGEGQGDSQNTTAQADSQDAQEAASEVHSQAAVQDGNASADQAASQVGDLPGDADQAASQVGDLPGDIPDSATASDAASQTD